MSSLVALLLLLCWVAAGMYAIRERRMLRFLSELSPDLPADPPTVTIIFAARNEGSTVAEAARSMAEQRYPNLEVIAVNDRSDDDTGTYLKQVAAAHPNLRVLEVQELPPGWLGKTHALARGAEAASGDWLLFTDADVHFAPDAVARAVSYAESEGLDHLTIAPHFVAKGVWLQALLAFFSTLMALLYSRRRIRSGKMSAGIGAFNLVRREVYRRAGGHEAIRLCVDDDIKLGAVLRAAGARQDLLPSGGLLKVPWYGSLGEAIRGFEKNAYSGSDYRPGVSVLQVVGLLAFFVAPAVWALAGLLGALRGVWVSGWVEALAATLVFLTLALAVSTTGAGLSPASALLAPVGAALFAFAVGRAVWLGERRGGIRWRGTFYSLSQLRSIRHHRGQPGALLSRGDSRAG